MTADDLATLQITRVIFHDIPQRGRDGQQQPVLSEIESAVDANKVRHLRDRLKRALGSPRAYEIQFDAGSASPVPGTIRDCTAKTLASEEFVAASHVVARYLFEQQNRVISPGLLAVMDCVVQAQQSFSILKLEREEGEQLELSERNGKLTFDWEVLTNLVLTDGTRFFKSALFHRKGDGPDEFSALACDDQLRPSADEQMAQFWKRFLGCRVVEDARITTEKFFNASIEYISDVIPDPVLKASIYEHVLSELKSNKKQFSPRTFIETYFPEEHQRPFRVFLEERNVTLRQFPLDTSEIANRLKRKSFVTVKGAVVTVPADQSDIVTVQKHKIIVSDTVKRVSKS
jgi:hypothetical protein